MKRYFITSNLDTLEVFSAPFETQPENSLPYEQNGFIKPCFDKYPNPTNVIEGITEQDLIEIKSKERLAIPETPLWRIRAVLKFMGQEENIASALASLPEPTKTGAEYIWNYGTVIERNSQTVLFLQSVLQMTDAQVDEIFNQANNIQI